MINVILYFMKTGEGIEEECSGIHGLFNEAMAKVLDFLLTFEGFEYSKPDIAINSEIDYKTFCDLWEKLEYHGVVKETMSNGKITLYTLNTESAIVKALKKLQYEIIFYDASKIAREHAEEAIIQEGEKVKA